MEKNNTRFIVEGGLLGKLPAIQRGEVRAFAKLLP